ncbi:MAG: EAL domain-containing protein [Pseudomonadota bacterium]
MHESLCTLIDVIPDFVAIKDGSGNWLMANKSGLEAFGLKGNEYIGKSDLELSRIVPSIYSNGLLACIESDRRAWELGTQSFSVEEVPQPDGSALQFHVIKVPIFYSDGSRNKLIVLGRNVTELMRAREKEKLAEKILKYSHEAIVVTDSSNSIIRVNETFKKITGYSESEVLGHNPRMFSSGRHGKEFYSQMWTEIILHGHWHGEIWDKRKNGEIFPKWLSISAVHDDDGKITNYVAAFIDTTEQKATIEKINFLAHHDPLTKLPNRILLADRFEQAIAITSRNNNQLACLYIDLDNFKEINDTLGHSTGDMLLLQAKERLISCVRDTDTICRLGGDEFVIVLPDLHGLSAAQGIPAQILEKMRVPYSIDGHTLYSSCSIGISIYPADGEDMETLLKKADAAMYHAKKNGRNGYRFHTEQMNLEALERMHIQNHLRLALKNNEFTLHYQPQYELGSKRLIGIEALIRWNSAENGIVPPNKFIPIAEEGSLIIEIGNWVITESCRQIREWSNQGYMQVPIAINLSPAQFRHGDLVKRILEATRKFDISPSLLELELTESILLENTEKTIETLHELKNYGFKLSIDDFGTGYSSLMYLKNLPVDKLKIDQSFVRNCTVDASDAAIIKSIVSLGHSLSLRVIAEGVEMQSQFDFLHREACDEIQGFLLGKPKPANIFWHDLDGEVTGLVNEGCRNSV